MGSNRGSSDFANLTIGYLLNGLLFGFGHVESFRGRECLRSHRDCALLVEKGNAALKLTGQRSELLCCLVVRLSLKDGFPHLLGGGNDRGPANRSFVLTHPRRRVLEGLLNVAEELAG